MAIDLFTIGSFTVHGYGLMIGLGFLLSVIGACKQAQKDGLSADHISNIAIWTLVMGFLGGKILFCIVEIKSFIANPLACLGSEGFVVYGGIIVGIATIFTYCKIKKIDTGSYFDLIVTFVPLNQAFGRLGCFLAGCCYGRATNSALGVVFPEGCLAPAGVKLIPTQLMMAVGDFLIFAALYYAYKHRKTKGIVVALYLILYSIGRFIIEFFRNDVRGSVGSLSTSQFIAIWTLGAGIVIMIYLLKKQSKSADPSAKNNS